MSAALQIMFTAIILGSIVGFAVSGLIYVLCKIISLTSKDDSEEMAHAVAIAVALSKKG